MNSGSIGICEGGGMNGCTSCECIIVDSFWKSKTKKSHAKTDVYRWVHALRTTHHHRAMVNRTHRTKTHQSAHVRASSRLGKFAHCLQLMGENDRH